MNKSNNKHLLFTPENVEKNILWIMSAIGFAEFAILSWILQTGLVLTLYFVLVCLAITGMLIRKGMKYSITARGVSLEYNDKDNPKKEAENENE